jgi:hypothetical protein
LSYSRLVQQAEGRSPRSLPGGPAWFRPTASEVITLGALPTSFGPESDAKNSKTHRSRIGLTVGLQRSEELTVNGSRSRAHGAHAGSDCQGNGRTYSARMSLQGQAGARSAAQGMARVIELELQRPDVSEETKAALQRVLDHAREIEKAADSGWY